MRVPLDAIIFFGAAFALALVMLAEGWLIAGLGKQINPLPVKVLYGLGVLLVGKEQSVKKVPSGTAAKDLRIYAAFVLVFGVFILISSLVYLFTAVV